MQPQTTSKIVPTEYLNYRLLAASCLLLEDVAAAAMDVGVAMTEAAGAVAADVAVTIILTRP